MTLADNGSLDLTGNVIVNGSIYSNSIQTDAISIGLTSLSTNLNATASAFDKYTTQTIAGFETATDSAVLTIGPGTSNRSRLFALYNSNGQMVSEISASGSAQFADLTTKQITIAAPGTFGSTQINGQTQSNATAGTATLPAGQTELVVNNTLVNGQTMVYLTPISNTQNQVLFVKSKTDGQSFTVAVNQSIGTDIQFNYWLIKVQ
jgi:hypothetical protein